MKKYLPALAAAVAFLIVGATLRAPRNASAYDFIGFGQLPTLVNGRSIRSRAPRCSSCKAASA